MLWKAEKFMKQKWKQYCGTPCSNIPARTVDNLAMLHKTLPDWILISKYKVIYKSKGRASII